MREPEQNGPASAPEQPLTRDDRSRLGHAYQAEAARRTDLRSANLGVLAGDLMLLAHDLAEQIEVLRAAARDNPIDAVRYSRTVENLLKVQKQLERTVALDRRDASSDDPPGTRVPS
jgi:hypothetical protein